MLQAWLGALLPASWGTTQALAQIAGVRVSQSGRGSAAKANDRIAWRTMTQHLLRTGKAVFVALM